MKAILRFIPCLAVITRLSAEDRPNFIFFLTDDISFDDLGAYGNTFVKTPNLDRIAPADFYHGKGTCQWPRGRSSSFMTHMRTRVSSPI